MKFASFFYCEPNVIDYMTLKEHLMMKINDFQPQYKKSGLAEINFDVVHHALPNIIQFHYAYPKLHQLKVVIKGCYYS